MSEEYPATASSLLLRGKIFSQTSSFGEGTPNHHPVVESFIGQQLSNRPQRFRGNCGELALVSDQLWGLDAQRTDGAHTSFDEARQYFQGAIITSKKIRPNGDPQHGQSAEPCWMCTELLNTLGIQILAD